MAPSICKQGGLGEGPSSRLSPALTWADALRRHVLHQPRLCPLLQQGDDLGLGGVLPYTGGDRPSAHAVRHEHWEVHAGSTGLETTPALPRPHEL